MDVHRENDTKGSNLRKSSKWNNTRESDLWS